ncbi:MAG: argininosuccinate lyase [Chthoniobacterales bacterium]
MRRPLHIIRLLAVATAFAFPAAAQALNLDFELVNGTGWAIKEVYISPATVNDWQENVISKPMDDGDSYDITFHPDADVAKWDMRIVWVDEGEDVVWQALDLSKISKLTLRYNPETNETSADAE